MMKIKLLLTSVVGMSLLLTACNAAETGLGWKHENPAAPTAGSWKVVEFPDGSKYSIDEPPANDSPTTKKELEELRTLAENRSEEDIEVIRRWSSEITGPNTNWAAVTEQMLKKYQLAPPEAARIHQIVSGAIYTASVAAFDEKYHYLRPRPTHLDPNLTLIDNFTVPAHPAYPSAHATTGWAASTVLSYIFPDEKEIFIAMSKEADLSRKLAGVHYESDNAAGKKLGQQIAQDIIDGLKDDNAPLQYQESGENHGGGTGH
ncbi:phosphatase PAP2 family protein [Brevibacillus dissolubilis]|uniref:phosphatase PAP2 family protein n=1 Tax=Brevibacillus dissolubilis TaxID=1844116 RepID=UPI001115CF1B|nr:phosphatase PAP2 family protein [Brevibacillus dissolubilis]